MRATIARAQNKKQTTCARQKICSHTLHKLTREALHTILTIYVLSTEIIGGIHTSYFLSRREYVISTI